MSERTTSQSTGACYCCKLSWQLVAALTRSSYTLLMKRDVVRPYDIKFVAAQPEQAETAETNGPLRQLIAWPKIPFRTTSGASNLTM